jgi:hypothetical protein
MLNSNFEFSELVQRISPIFAEFLTLTKVKSSSAELVILYNYIPHFLEHLVVPVSLTSDSFCHQSQRELFLEKNELFLEKNKNGNGWIIATDDDKYWLFPKVNLKINSLMMTTFVALFKVQNEPDAEISEFILLKPAIVSRTDNGNQWKLEEPGELEFCERPPSSELQVELKRSREENLKQVQVVQSPEDLQTYPKCDVDRLNAQVQDLIIRVKKLEDQASHCSNLSTQQNPIPPASEPQNKIEVAETSESINQRRSGSTQTVLLQEVSRNQGSYWIYTEGDSEYLIPKDEMVFNEYNCETLKALFSYNLIGESSRFQVLRPCRVRLISDQTWQLIEKGELQFY